jgi:hypothetical protein
MYEKLTYQPSKIVFFCNERNNIFSKKCCMYLYSLWQYGSTGTISVRMFGRSYRGRYPAVMPDIKRMDTPAGYRKLKKGLENLHRYGAL